MLHSNVLGSLIIMTCPNPFFLYKYETLWIHVSKKWQESSQFYVTIAKCIIEPNDCYWIPLWQFKSNGLCNDILTFCDRINSGIIKVQLR